MVFRAIKQIKDDVNAVFDRDPAARNSWEVLFTYPGIHALIYHRMAHFFWRYGMKFIARVIAYISRMITGIEIHPAAKIGKRLFIDHGMGVVIGETAEIGDDVTLYHGVTLGGVSWNKGKRHPTLEDGVVVGAGSKVLGPFTVGKNAKIGSNTVVVKPVPAGATMVGTPARMVQREKTADEQRAEYAQKIGFQAYGALPDMPDPVIDGFKKLLDQLHTTDQQINTLKQAMCKLDPEFCDVKYEPLTEKDIELINDSKKQDAPNKNSSNTEQDASDCGCD